MRNMIEVHEIELNNEIYELRFGHKALKKAEKLLKRPLLKLVSENMSLEEIETLFICAISHKVNLSKEQASDLLDGYNTMYLIEAITKAFMGALGTNQEEVDNNKKK